MVRYLKLPTRSIELSLLQRCPSHIASLTDILEASSCGAHAVKFAVQGVSGEMVIMERKSDVPYEITYTHYPLSAIANEVKTVPVEWIVDECDISQEFIKYCLPLINGETKYKYENGLPRFVKLAKIKAK